MKRETIDLFNRIFKVLEPPPDLTLSQWADKYRRLSSESGSKGGRWDTSKAPPRGNHIGNILIHI